MGSIKPFDIRRLKPFHRQGARLPEPSPDEEDKIADLDPNLTHDEHASSATTLPMPMSF